MLQLPVEDFAGDVGVLREIAAPAVRDERALERGGVERGGLGVARRHRGNDKPQSHRGTEKSDLKPQMNTDSEKELVR